MRTRLLDDAFRYLIMGAIYQAGRAESYLKDVGCDNGAIV